MSELSGALGQGKKESIGNTWNLRPEPTPLKAALECGGVKITDPVKEGGHISTSCQRGHKLIKMTEAVVKPNLKLKAYSKKGGAYGRGLPKGPGDIDRKKEEVTGPFGVEGWIRNGGGN